jgi:hypothetical protein
MPDIKLKESFSNKIAGVLTIIKVLVESPDGESGNITGWIWGRICRFCGN